MTATHARRVFLCVVLGMTLTMVACGSNSNSSSNPNPTPNAPTTEVAAAPQRGGAVAFGLEADPNGLDPTRNAFDAVGRQVASSIFDTWVSVDANGSDQPNLAKSFDHSPDYKQWTLHIRSGVVFSDGTKLDADAALASFNAFKASAVTGAIFRTLNTVEKLDALTLRLTFDAAWATFPAILHSQVGMVASPKQLVDPDGQSHPVGSGPFKLDKWEQSKSIKLVRNPDYWRKDSAGTPLPYLDAVTFKVVPDGATRTADLQSRDLDIVQARSIADTKSLDSLASQPRFTITHDPGNTETAFVLLNTAKAPLDDVRVRQAIAYATDQKALAAQNDWPESKLADSPFGSSSPWHTAVNFPRHDLAKAKKLIDDYKASTGKAVTIELASPFDASVLQEISEQWRAAGIEVTVNVVDTRITVVNAVFGKYDAILFSYFALVDPDEGYMFWHSQGVADVGMFSINFTRMKDPEIDAALDRARSTEDVVVRAKDYAIVQQRFADLVPYVWLYQLDWIIATWANVKQAKAVTTADGRPAMPYLDGVFPLTETYLVN